jgi:N-acetyl-anhydromuramyl-L-alanine amidase AmpD
MGMPERNLVNKVVPATQFWKGREGHKVDKVLIHVAQSSTLSGVESWFGTPGNGCKTSAHYIIGQAGEIVQCVSEADTAYHAGDWQWNLTSIGIEHVGWSGKPFTPPQIHASAKLVAKMCRGYGVHTANILPHAACPHTTHKMCPGDSFPWTEYHQLVQQYMQQQ